MRQYHNSKQNKKKLREAAIKAGLTIPNRIKRSSWDEIFQMKSEGRMLNTVKVLKETFKCGLKEAKDFHDNWDSYSLSYSLEIDGESTSDKITIKETEEFDNFIEIRGNLLDMFSNGDFDMIAHGCNCMKSMSAGIAYQIARRFPDAEMVDTADSRSSLERFGDMTSVRLKRVGSAGLIINLYTQFNPGADFHIGALRTSLYKLNKKFTGHSIGVPLIGCGIGGGNWDEVQKVMKEELKDMRVTVVHFTS